MYLDVPRHLSFWGGLATARLPATNAQINAQNAPVNMPLLTPKLAEKLILQCQLVPTVGSIHRPRAPFSQFQGLRTVYQVTVSKRLTFKSMGLMCHGVGKVAGILLQKK